MTTNPAGAGNVQEVAHNLYSLRLPMPFGLDHINVYLLRETNRLALVDCGLDLPDSWAALTRAFESLGLNPCELTDIFVTHAHPDHIGQLPRLRQLAPHARLYIHRQEFSRLAERNANLEQSEQYLRGWLDRNGAFDLDARVLTSSGLELLPRLQTQDKLLDGGEQIGLKPEGEQPEWEILWTPGHTAGHFVLWSNSRRLLLSGDHLLTSISSNIGKYPGSTEDPLGDFIASLQRIAELPVQTVLPAHGEPFTNHRERITHLVAHHRHRLEKIYTTLEPGPRTAIEVVQAIWAERAQGFHRYLALVEALSHLERLRREGRVIAEDEKNTVRYRVA